METDDNAQIAPADARVDDPALEALSPEPAESLGSGKLDLDTLNAIIDQMPDRDDDAPVASPAVEPEEDDDDDEPQSVESDEDSVPTEKLAKHHRVTAERPEDAKALSIFRAARGALTLAEAAAIAEGKKPGAVKAPEEVPVPVVPPIAEESPSLSSILEREAELRSARKNATVNLDLDKVAELTDEIDSLQDAKFAARQREAQAALEQASAIQLQFDASMGKAVSLYPDSAKAGEFSDRIIAIDHALQANGDPLFSDPNKPLILAQMAARELGIAPANAVAKSPVPAIPNGARSVQPAKPQPRPVNGARGNGSSASVRFDPSVLKSVLRSTDDVEALTEAFLRS